MEYEEMDNSTEDVLDDVVEEPEEVEEESLDTLEEPAEEPEPPKAKKEPGYVKQRIESAVQKALAEQRESLRAELDKQYAPIREKLLDMEAQELVNNGQISDIEMAKKYVRAMQGMPAENPQPRQANGQFAPKEDPATTARINMLKHQRETIQREEGIDPAELYDSDEEVKMKIIRGEMDFYDAAKMMKAKSKRKPPSPMRSPNGASGTNPNAIDSMSDAQFEKMEKRIKEGARYTLR